MAVSFGRGIIANYGNKTFWMLYLGGAIAGAISMAVFKPHNSIIIPEVGAGPALSSLITFYALNNMHSYVYLFAFPIKMWVLFAAMGVFSITDPSKKDFGGMLMGLFMFLVFKTRM
jgi:membrane associated rhomboid family serine protease